MLLNTLTLDCFFFKLPQFHTSNFRKVVRQHTEGMVGSTTWILLEIYLAFQQWKNFENPLRIDKVIAMSSVCSFLAHPVYTHNAAAHGVRSEPKSAQNASFRATMRLFGGTNNVLLNFGHKTPKTELLLLWIGLSSVNDKKANTCNYNTVMSIMTNFCRAMLCKCGLCVCHHAVSVCLCVCHFHTFYRN